MDRPGGVAGQRQPRRGKASRAHALHRVATARPGERQRSQPVADAAPHGVEEAVVVERGDGVAGPRMFGPHQRRPVARQGKDREGTAGKETLLRYPAMGEFVRDGADERRLAIAATVRGDAGARAGGGVLAVRRDGEPRLHDRPVVEGRAQAGSGGRHRRKAPRREEDDAVQRRGATVEGAPEEAVLDHVAERPPTEFGAVEMEEHPRVAVADADLVDRFGVAGEGAPDARVFEDGDGPGGDGGSAAVERRVETGRRVARVHEDYGKPPVRKGAGDAESDGARADDEEVGIVSGHDILHRLCEHGVHCMRLMRIG